MGAGIWRCRFLEGEIGTTYIEQICEEKNSEAGNYRIGRETVCRAHVSPRTGNDW